MIEPTQTLECISKKIEELGVDGIIADEVVDGLMAAMEDPEVDTIYLLTDGLPNSDPDEILEAVMRENRTRQIIIHCISIGMKSPLLMDLAAMTGGQYKEVR